MTSVSATHSGASKAVVALLVAALFFGIYFLQRLLSYLVGAVILSSQNSIGSREIGSQLSYFFWNIAAQTLPFALGVFLCVWFVRPLVSELGLASVIRRSLVASVCGAATVVVFAIVWAVFTGFDVSAGRVYGWAAGLLGTAAEDFGALILGASIQGMELFISSTPLVVLAGLLGWFWLRSRPTSVSD